MIVEIAVVATTVALVGVLFWLPGALRRHPRWRSRSTSPTAGAMASVDAAFHGTAADAHADLDRQHHWVQPAPTPDPDRRLDNGKLRIDLP